MAAAVCSAPTSTPPLVAAAVVTAACQSGRRCPGRRRPRPPMLLRRRRARGACPPATATPMTGRRATPRRAGAGEGRRGGEGENGREYPCFQKRGCPWRRRVSLHSRTGDDAGDGPSWAGTVAAAAAGMWPQTSDCAAKGAAADAATDTARSVSPRCVAGRSWPRHGGRGGRTRAPRLRQRARRWHRPRRLVPRRMAAGCSRALRRRQWRRCHPQPLFSLFSNPPPPPHREWRCIGGGAAGVASTVTVTVAAAGTPTRCRRRHGARHQMRRAVSSWALAVPAYRVGDDNGELPPVGTVAAVVSAASTAAGAAAAGSGTTAAAGTGSHAAAAAGGTAAAIVAAATCQPDRPTALPPRTPAQAAAAATQMAPEPAKLSGFPSPLPPLPCRDLHRRQRCAAVAATCAAFVALCEIGCCNVGDRSSGCRRGCRRRVHVVCIESLRSEAASGRHHFSPAAPSMLGAVSLSKEAPTRRELGRRPLCGGIGEAFAAAPSHMERFQRGSAAAPAKPAAAAAAIRCCHRRQLCVDKRPHADGDGRAES